jgi:hypothetical protein
VDNLLACYARDRGFNIRTVQTYFECMNMSVYIYCLIPIGARCPTDQCASARKVKQRWSLIGWATKNLFSRVLPFFGMHVKLLVPVALAVVSTCNTHWARVVGYGPISLCVIHKEGLCPSSGDINRLKMMIPIVQALLSLG